MFTDEQYMYRALDLARLGAQYVAPNPMVGAVLVYENRIIGEGWYQQDGAAHAEVNAVASVAPEDRHLIPKSTLYVSLEPCTIFGRTPPCTNLIIRKKIPCVVIATTDKTKGVDGSSAAVLRAAGCTVRTNVLEAKARQVASMRNTFVAQNRPYIILKWAQSADGFLGKPERQVWLTNAISKRLVHQWRSETQAILVGTNTAVLDNPQLTNRLYYGPSPLRIVLDRQGSIPVTHYVVQDGYPTWFVTESDKIYGIKKNVQIPFNASLLPKLLSKLAEANISSLMVEGGTHTLQQFLNLGLWDEARVFVTRQYLVEGIAAPVLKCPISQNFTILNDTLRVYKPT